ncbi:FAD-dependent monooxygenase [Streptomyces sp. NPDC058678]|uniref:FAD-dependent monooxygenase n=1 Tax=Streptomyces sp. NPDC058678 TaxID=3346595 RepID=UPI00364A4749
MNSQDNRHATGLRVAVVGGGIGGLATAAFLHRAGIASTVYEQAPALAEVGAGLVVSPNAVRLLRSLGQLDRLRGRGGRLLRFRLLRRHRRAHRRRLADQPSQSVATPYSLERDDGVRLTRHVSPGPSR